MRPTGLLVAAGLLMGACGIFGPDEERVIGRIDSDSDPMFIVPDSVAVGQAFTVTVVTGGDSCYRNGDTEVRIEGNIAVVTPYDFRRNADVCFSLLQFFDHQATILFDVTGGAQVKLRASTLLGDPIELTRVVQVY